jgi:hypothetical protein
VHGEYALSSDDHEQILVNRRNQIATAYPVVYFPAKCLAFFKIQDKIHCLIHFCDSKKNSDEDSCLTECWNLEYTKFRNSSGIKDKIPIMRICEEAASFADRVFLVEESIGVHGLQGSNSSRIIMIKKKAMWEKYFTDTA